VLHAVEQLIRPGSRGAAIINFVVIPLLVLAVLLTPPISFADRVMELTYAHFNENGGRIRLSDGAELSVPSGVLKASVPVRLDIIPLADFPTKAPSHLRLATMTPPRLKLKSAVYPIDTRGSEVDGLTISMPIPTGVADEELTRIDIYAWDGAEWVWQPTTVLPDDDLIVGHLTIVPKAVALFAIEAARPILASFVPRGGSISELGADLLSEVNPHGVWVNADGTLMGTVEEPPAIKGSRYVVIPTVQNYVDGQFDGDLIANILQNKTLRRNLLTSILQLVDRNVYAGINVDFRRLPSTPEDRANFVSFINELGSELHARHKILSLTLEAPQRVSDDPRPEFAWRTGGYDWLALGQAPDSVKVLINAEPASYLSTMNQVFRFATSQVNRLKLQPVISIASRVVNDQGIHDIPYSEALEMAAAMEVVDAPNPIVAGEGSVILRLANLTTEGGNPALTWDSAAKAARFTYKDKARVGTVWLENGFSLNYKLDLLSHFSLKGFTLRDAGNELIAPPLWETIRAFAASGQVPLAEPNEEDLKLNWKATGGTVQVSPTGLQATWKAPPQQGTYSVSPQLPVALTGPSMSVEGKGVTLNVVVPTPTRQPTPTPQPQAVAAAEPAPAPKVSAPASSPAVGKYPFGYGIQIHAIHNDHGPIMSAVVGMGFGWIKQQVEWRDYEPNKGNYQWGELDRLVNSANAAGIKILFSILRSPAWANSHPDGPPRNFNDLGDFLAAMASRYKGRVQAYEVWNEQNLGREWQGHQLSAAKYVELLGVAYRRIKEVDPDAVVVAGALTPTGVNDGVIAIDDRLYLRQMYEAGLKDVSDAIGIHPSGFANPPDARWPEPKPSAPSHNNHPSFYFRNTMEDYRAIMVEYGDGRKQLWPTEFGWAVSAKPEPGYEYAAYNTEETRARWIVQAYQMAKAWGWVGPMFLWNLNFRITSPGTEMAAFGIMNPGWSPTPAYAALRDMPK